MPKLNRIYGWDKLIRPQRTLFRHTDFKNSNWGWFKVYWWNNASGASLIWFDTTNWYVYSTGNHSNARTKWEPTEYSLFQDADAVKIICKGIYRWNNTNQYNTSVGIWWIAFNKSSSTNSVGWWTLLTWELPDFWTWYECEFLIKKGEYGILTVSNWSTYQWSKTWNELVSTASWWWFPNSTSYSWFSNISKDQWTWCQMKDVYVYIWKFS